MKRLTVLLIALLCIGSTGLSTPTQARDRHTGLLLETIGVLSAQGVYLTYTSIGTLADGHAKGNYKDDFSVKLLNEYNALSRSSIKQLNKLLSSGVLGQTDVTFVAKLIQTFELLTAQSNGYKNYILTQNKAHLKVYSEKRREAWKNIAELLGLNK